MRKKFILNLILLIFLNLLVKPFYVLGIDTEVLNRVGQEAYGMYFALINLSFLLNIFLDLGIVNFNTSNIAKHSHLLTKHFGGITAIRLLLSFLYLIVCLIVAVILGYRGASMVLLLPICLNQMLSGFILYFRSNLSGLHLFATDSLVSVMDRILLIVMCSFIFWGNIPGISMSVELFVYLQTAAYTATCIVSFMLVKQHTASFKPIVRKHFTLAILKKSFPYALLILLMSFYYRTDGIMLERMLPNGAYEAGIYAQAYRFFEAGNMVSYLFATLVFPMFSRLLGNKKELHDLMMLSFKVIFAGSVVFGILGFQFSNQIMDLRFDTEVVTAGQVFRVLMISFIAVSGTYIFGTLLTANGNLRQLNILALSAALINVILNLILIPKYKAEGAAVASAITQVGVLIGQIILVQAHFHFNRFYKELIRMLLLPLLSVIALNFIVRLDIHWYSQAALFVIVGLILALVTGLLKREYIQSLFTIFKSRGKQIK